MRLRLLAVLIGLAMPALAGRSDAACVCLCMDGRNQPICESAIDLKPICPPRVCPIAPPSVAPIQPPRVPPLGRSSCEQKQVLNPNTGRYEWREVCR